MELVGRVADRHLARSDGARGAGAEGGVAGPTSFAVRPEASAPAISRSSSSATPAKATPRSTCCAISCCRSPTAPTCASSSSRPTSCIRPARCATTKRSSGCRSRASHEPVYAIPGNHDWYDALEAFNVTFLQPDAARASIRARVESDLRLTSTTDGRIERLIQEAARLREAYGVPDRLSARAVLRGADGRLRAARDRHRRAEDRSTRSRSAGSTPRCTRAAGKMTWRSSGHPFFAGGHDVTRGRRRVRAAEAALLLDHGVTIVMAGDTHDLEYYAERRGRRRPAVHHFVNGGGGAYLSFGTALELARAAADRRLGVLSRSPGRGEKIEAHARRGGSGRPGGGRRDSTPGRSRPSGCRRCSTTTSRRSFRASSR